MIVAPREGIPRTLPICPRHLHPPLTRLLSPLFLLQGAKQLRDLLVTMILSFPSLLNVASLLGLILFIY